MKSTSDDGGGNELSLGTISGIVSGGIVIIIIGGGIPLLVIFLFKKIKTNKSVGMLYTKCKTIFMMKKVKS